MDVHRTTTYMLFIILFSVFLVPISADIGSRDIHVYVSDVNPNITEVNITEHVLISALIENDGTDNATDETVDFFIDAGPTPVMTTEVDVSAMGWALAVFDWDTTGHSPGNHTVTAKVRSSGSEYTSENITLIDAPRPNLYVHDFKVDPPVAHPGDPVALKAIIRNNGTADANNVSIRFYQGSVHLETVKIDVPMDDVDVPVTVQWNTTGLAPGNYTLKVEIFLGDVKDSKSKLGGLMAPKVKIEVTEVECEPIQVHPGDMTTIWIIVENQGTDLAMDIIVSVYDGGQMIGSTYIDWLEGFGENQTSYDYDIPLTASLGNHTIKVTAVDSNRTALLLVTERLAERTFEITLDTPSDIIGLHERITVLAHVKYIGPEDAPNVTVILREEQVPKIGEQNLGKFVPGQSKTAYFNYTGEASGVHILTAYIAETGESNQLLITVMPTPSTSLKVDITDPTNNSVVSDDITVKAYAKVPYGMSISKVELYLDGALSGEMSRTQVIGEYVLDLDTSLEENGSHKVKAVVTTTNAKSSESPILHLTFKNGVDPPPPPPAQRYETTVNENPWFPLLFMILMIIAVISIIAYRVNRR